MYPNINTNMFRSGIQLLRSIDFPALLDGTSKTLGVINQAIPVYNQLKPIISNIGTLSKISKVMNDNDSNDNKTNNSPLFYI